MFIDDNTLDFDNFKSKLSGYKTYAEKAGVSADIIAKFAEEYNKEINAILIFSEKNISEIFWLTIILE